MNESRLGLDVLIGLPIAGFFALIGLAGIAVGIWMFRKRKPVYYGDWDLPAKSVLAAGLTVLVLTLGFTALGMYPYGAEYHRWEPKSGEVSQVDSRLLGDGGGGATQRFVVRLNGGQQEYACDDTRCSLLKVGDILELSCIREWQYSGSDGYACNYFSSKSSGKP